MIEYYNALNCFTDASTTKGSDGIVSSCAGYVLTYHGEVIDRGERILYNSTNNEGELYAILMGVKALLSYSYMDTFLNLFSDSRISIEGLRSWCINWSKSQDKNGILYGTNGKEVANQKIIKYIIHTIYYSKIHMQLFCQLVHINTCKVDDMTRSISYFLNCNGVKISNDIAVQISGFNNMVDNNTRKYLAHSLKKNHGKLSKFGNIFIPINYTLSDSMIDEYIPLLMDANGRL
jgi:ribonuclease HI